MTKNIDQLYIFDLSEVLIAVLRPDDIEVPFYDAYHLEQINGENSFRFKIPAEHIKAEYIVEGNLVAFKDLDGDFQLFEIKIINEIHEKMLIKEVFCEHAIFELLDELIIFQWDRVQTATTILTDALAGTRWSVGTVSVPGLATVRMEIENPIEIFKEMIEAFNAGEFKYRVTISGKNISGRYVDFLERRGIDTGKRFEYSKDVNSIRREIDLTNVKTALWGFGKAQEVPGGIRRVRFDNVQWTDPPNPRNKPYGDEFIGDLAARTKWGRDGGTRHRWGFYENPDQLNPTQLLIETNDRLNELINPRFSYVMKAVDLERFSGLFHERIRLGDTVRTIDHSFNPAMVEETRIVEIRRYLTEPEKDVIVLDTVKFLITQEGTRIRDLERRVHNNEGVWGDSAYKNNMITDHAFENIPRIFGAGSPDADQVYEVSKVPPPDGDYGSIFWWQWVGIGYVISSYNDTTLKEYEQLALYDYQAAVISTVTGKISHVYQYVPLNKSLGINGPYTISCYVTAFVQTAIDGNAVIEVFACTKDTTRLNGGATVGRGTVFLLAAEPDVWRRNIVTISNELPSGTELLEVRITSDTAEFKYLCDGVQLIPMDTPASYDPETNLWKMMRRFPGTKLQYPIFLGDSTTTGMYKQLKPETFRAYQTIQQTVTSGIWTKATFTNEDYDLRNVYDTGLSRFGTPQEGYFSVVACVGFTVTGVSRDVEIAIYKNGSMLEIIGTNLITSLGIVFQVSGSSIVKLNDNDFLEIFIKCSVNSATVIGTENTHFHVYRLG